MADLVLFSKFAQRSDHGGTRVLATCLLVYDEEHFTDEALSNDLREQLEANPTLSRIYVVAPRVNAAEVVEQVRGGSSQLRPSQHGNDEDPLLRIVLLNSTGIGNGLELTEFFFIRESEKKELEDRSCILDPELVQGWLFDLFLQREAMVLAPSGVHFGKTSGKHSDRFLRTANTLTSSAACRLLAFFCVPLLPKRKLRQVYVDTSPILSLGLALVEVSRLHGISIESGRVRSFGSYSGMRGDLDFRQSDLLLVSASTSGGLVKQLIERGADESAIVTLFYLQAKGWTRTAGCILADLTHKKDAQFGFPEVSSYEHGKCPLCDQGLLLAEFEGDQFLLQKRKTRRLKITAVSQSKSARVFFELASRNQAIAVSLVGTGRSRYSDINIDVNKLLAQNHTLRSELAFKLRRTTPSPLDLIVSDDCDVSQLSMWSASGNRHAIPDDRKLVDSSELVDVAAIQEGGVLVYFSSLDGDLAARAINRSLRSVAPKGSIGYLATLLISDSPEARRDLLSFLKYGERGPNTFVFESVHDLLLSQRQERLPWDLERDHLARLDASTQLPSELCNRLEFLRANNQAFNSVFMPGQKSELGIANDFVYLDTNANKEQISQADIYAVVSNLLAACRNDNRDISAPIIRGKESHIWEQSVYGQVLLCPRNFKDFNDGVLHAAFLRAAKSSELRYDTDETLSEEMLEIMLAEVNGWKHGSGQALAEFALAIATRRLSLKTKHLQELMKHIRIAEGIPPWIALLVHPSNL